MDIQKSMLSYEIVLYFFVTLLSLIGFSMMGWDKRRAEKQKKRLSEKLLLTIGLLGGSVGIAFGMLIFKHKTSKKKFYVGIPGIYVLQWALFFGILYHNL